jgi:hypothetical protein
LELYYFSEKIIKLFVDSFYYVSLNAASLTALRKLGASGGYRLITEGGATGVLTAVTGNNVSVTPSFNVYTDLANTTGRTFAESSGPVSTAGTVIFSSAITPPNANLVGISLYYKDGGVFQQVGTVAFTATARGQTDSVAGVPANRYYADITPWAKIRDTTTTLYIQNLGAVPDGDPDTVYQSIGSITF